MLHEPYYKLKGKLREKNITYDELANELGISKSTLCRKICGISDFYISEVAKIETLGIPNNVF